MPDSQSVSDAVANLYNTYPFPPEPILDEPPPGYNWRWYWDTAYSFCTGAKPDVKSIRVLDAGCGTGVSTEYIAHLNPEAGVTGIDLSEQALATAAERCRRSGARNATFRHLSIYDADQLEGQFDWINCVGVLHHMPDPIRGIQALANKLAPGGIFHIFVYAAVGRWEISLMQRAIQLLQGERRGDYRDGVRVGRTLFDVLPDDNRLKRREKERWSLENQRDECFADMYVHPQEVDYTIDSLFELIEASGLQFVGFSNPHIWQLDRLLGGSDALLHRAQQLSQREQYRLIELIDPEITHFEWFLAKPPLPHHDWSKDEELLAAFPERNPCMDGWPSQSIFDHNYQYVNLSDEEVDLLQGCDLAQGQRTVADLLTSTSPTLQQVREMQHKQLILLRLPQPSS